MCLISCAISCLLKFAISIVNTLLMIMGIILLVIGALLLWGMNVFLQHIYDLQTQIQKLILKLNITADASGVISLVQQNATSIGAIAFAVGCVLIALAILGIIAVCCCSLKKILIVICIFLICITLGLIVLIAFYGSNTQSKIFDPLVNYLQKDVINKYQGISSTNPESIFVNVIQITANCCGLYNYTDFNNVASFNRNVTASDNQQYNLTFPLSCCQYQQDFTITTENRDVCIKNGTSPKITVGCWILIQPSLKTYLNYCFTTIGITIAVLVATIIVTIILIKCAEKFE